MAMRPALALLALAVVAVTARLLRRRAIESNHQSITDDSEVVGMPTTWFGFDEPDPTQSTTTLRELYRMYNGRLLGPGWYVELAPTSRN